jgi:predicted nucleic acid-binding protein
LELIEADARVLSSAQNLLERYMVPPRDSIHLASAIVRNVRIVVSDDEDFDKVKEIEESR